MKPRPSSTPSTRPCKKSPTAESRHTAILPPSWELVRKSQPSVKNPRLTRQTSPAPAPSRRLSQAFARRRLAALQPRQRAVAARHQRQRHHLAQVCLFFPSPRASWLTRTFQVSTRGQSEPGRCAAGRGRSSRHERHGRALGGLCRVRVVPGCAPVGREWLGD